MTLQQLTYFLAASEHGSFSAAAEALHMAQPSLSEQIRRLEAELGVSLFARAGRRLALTEAGRLLLEVIDDGRGFNSTSGGGTGLANIRARLSAMHAGAASLTLAENPRRGVTSRLELPVLEGRYAMS